VTHPRTDARIALVAGRQYGVITTAQLEAAGLERSQIAKRVRAGRLHPLHRGVYAAGHNRLSQEGRWMAAVLTAGKGAVLSHESAAKHWRIWRGRVNHIDVLTPGNRRARKGLRVHRARTLDKRDVTIHKGIPITTPARTLVDLASVLTRHQLANVIHEAAFRNLYDNGAVREAMERARGRDLEPLHAALRAHAAGSAGTRSALEDQFLETWQGPEPLVNTKIEVDMYWPAEHRVVEIDGPGHARPRSKREDAERDEALKAVGVDVVRIPSGHG
jgi:putative AbiEi antitoxin of type IV toxin-antitoxin system/transcriptional regulator with AbiEi antitoxin domain of type IV toxin-antitoxin system